MDATSAAATGVPWWVVVLATLATSSVTFLVAIVSTRSTRKTEKASNEQKLIDQLQEETRDLRTQSAGLRSDLNTLAVEVRTLRVREIAWITHTSTLTQIVAMAGQPVPPLPAELRHVLPFPKEN